MFSLLKYERYKIRENMPIFDIEAQIYRCTNIDGKIFFQIFTLVAQLDFGKTWT